MKLYVYDHCPYCVKARMIFGWKDINFELVTLLNDDEKTPIDMIGQKMVPIFVQEGKKPLPESLDIVKVLDKQAGSPMMSPSKEDPRLKMWLQGARQYMYQLAMPRWIKVGLEEFATESAVAYFTKKKEDYIGPFAEHMNKTQDYLDMAHQHLQELESIIQGEDFFWGECTEDDLHVFASLRCLTVVKGMKFPEKIEKYMNNMSESTKIPLHWDAAI
ncbi:MAG: glutaredoxin 2 [Bdellovibrionales bacterium]|nr:glutaredoxin 2 [Bdellovibrionales bacterium]